jgi:hypothetical protein
MRYLSDEWFAALSAAVADVDAPPTAPVTIAQVVSGTPGGDVRYRLSCAEGRCRVEVGDGPSHVTLSEDLATALEVATGARTAGHAVLHGDVVVSGDVARLIEVAPLLEALAPAVASVMARTTLPVPGSPA